MTNQAISKEVYEATFGESWNFTDREFEKAQRDAINTMKQHVVNGYSDYEKVCLIPDSPEKLNLLKPEYKNKVIEAIVEQIYYTSRISGWRTYKGLSQPSWGETQTSRGSVQSNIEYEIRSLSQNAKDILWEIGWINYNYDAYVDYKKYYNDTPTPEDYYTKAEVDELLTHKQNQLNDENLKSDDLDIEFNEENK